MTIKTTLASTGLLLLQQAQLSVAAPSRRDDGWFCSGNGASWDTELWQEHNIGDWLNNRVKWYSGMGGEWPKDVSGVPRSLAEYNGGDKDELYNWGTSCISVDSTCDLGESHLSTNPGCLDRGNRAFSLWAMRNSARFVQRYYAAITDVFDTSALSLASIATTFIDNGKTDTQMGTNAWFIIMSGVIGATTAFIPGGGAAIGGTVAGIMGIGIGILGSAKAVAIDPRFTTFADMQARLGDIKTETQKTLSVYYNRMYRDTPAQGDIGAGTELSYLLESGAWAEQDMAELSFAKEDIVRMIHAGIISEAWNSQQVALVKWSKGKLADIRGYNLDPCYGAPFESIQDLVACENDRNYIFVRFPVKGKSQSPWAELGWHDEHLEKFGLTHKIIIDASEHRQGISAEWVNRGLDFLMGDLASFATNPPADIADKLLPFNLAVCDLDVVPDIKWDQNTCVGDTGCMSSVVLNNCPRLLLNNVPFPYKRN